MGRTSPEARTHLINTQSLLPRADLQKRSTSKYATKRHLCSARQVDLISSLPISHEIASRDRTKPRGRRTSMRRTVTIMVAGALLIALTAGVALAATINCVGDSAKAPTTKYALRHLGLRRDKRQGRGRLRNP